jgi:hypothetical protein
MLKALRTHGKVQSTSDDFGHASLLLHMTEHLKGWEDGEQLRTCDLVGKEASGISES